MTIPSCPVCTSQGDHQLVHTLNSDAAAKHFFKYAGAQNTTKLREHIEELWGSEECQILRCRECLSRFAHPHIAGDSKFYELANPEAKYPEERWEFALTSKRTADVLKSGGRLLEIGGGSGFFVKQVLDLGTPATTITVLEYSADGRVELEHLGVRVEETDFRSEVAGGPFRVLVLFQTLEHLDRLDNAVEALSRLATNGSELFISVPNVAWIDWQEKYWGMLDMPPNHVTGFSSQGLRRLFDRSNWKVVSLEFQPPKPIIERAKGHSMRRISIPESTLETLFSRIAGINRPKPSSIRVKIGAGFALIFNFSWIRKIPSENILLHLNWESID
jgi:hypothetical protein